MSEIKPRIEIKLIISDSLYQDLDLFPVIMTSLGEENLDLEDRQEI